MNWKHPILRYLAIYTAVCVATLTPLAGLDQAEAAVGVKTLLVGGLVGGAALLAMGALSGPAGALGAIGAAGTGFSGLMGGAVGGLAGGTAGMMTGLGTLGTIALGLGGALLGAHFLGPLMASISPFVLVPALLVGGGLLVYSFLNRGKRMGTTYDARNPGLFDGTFWSAKNRLGNSSSTGYDSGSSSFLDRFRSVFDRDRRDDSAYWNQRYVDPNGYVRNNMDVWGKIDRFLNGKNGGWDTSQNQLYGIGYGNTRILDGYGNVATDQSGRVTIGTGSTSRTGLMPSAPTSSEDVETSGDVEANLKVLEEERAAAYSRLVELLKSQRGDASATAVVGESASGLASPEVLEAIKTYKEADRAIKELENRLQPREKQ